MFKRTSAIAALFAGAALLGAPANADEFGGVSKILKSEPVTFLADGFNREDRDGALARESDLRNDRLYENGAFFSRRFGGDPHRARVGRSGGNVLDIFRTDPNR